MDNDNYDNYNMPGEAENVSQGLVVMILRKLDTVNSITAQTTTSVARIEERMTAIASLASSITRHGDELSRISGTIHQLSVRTDGQQKEIDCLQDESRWSRRMISGAVFAALLSMVSSLVIFFMTRR